MENLKYWTITRSGSTMSATFDEVAWRKDQSAQKSEQVKRGMRKRAEKGLPTGAVPLGYVLLREGERTWVEVDPATAPLIREMFDLAASGKHSLRQILAAMTEKGLQSRKGAALGVSALRWLLRNPFYLGQVRFRDQAHSGGHAPLVDRQTFEHTDRALVRRRKR